MDSTDFVYVAQYAYDSNLGYHTDHCRKDEGLPSRKVERCATHFQATTFMVTSIILWIGYMQHQET